MTNLYSKLSEYCSICQYVHEEYYLVCDYCNEHKQWISLEETRYYNHGLSKRNVNICSECRRQEQQQGQKYRLSSVTEDASIYQAIMEAIKDLSLSFLINKLPIDQETGTGIVDYYHAVRSAYRRNEDLILIGSVKDIDREINKDFSPIWKFTYKIVSKEGGKRIKVVNKNPDNLLVSWIKKEIL